MIGHFIAFSNMLFDDGANDRVKLAGVFPHDFERVRTGKLKGAAKVFHAVFYLHGYLLRYASFYLISIGSST